MKCLDCPLDAVAGSKRCRMHRVQAAVRRADFARDDTRRRREAYAALDLCVQCGDPKDPDSLSYCRRCLGNASSASRARRNRTT
jgi:hypothetical protein